jgi:hypothetical protein
MAELPNDAGTLRLRIELWDREAPVRGPLVAEGTDGRTPSGRLLARAGVEVLDRRDGEWWPLLRLPPILLAPGAVQALVGALQDVLQGTSPGAAWQAGEEAPLGLQVGAPEGGEAGALLVEVGLDLSLHLADVSASPRRPGAELALFRWTASRSGAVAFAAGLRREAGALGADG